ncbi:MAG: hypothetical protein JW902_08520 [Syntrophaceae bacterium]|nr:hypothetical protein [Syntrophaceae bacterium]
MVVSTLELGSLWGYGRPCINLAHVSFSITSPDAMIALMEDAWTRRPAFAQLFIFPTFMQTNLDCWKKQQSHKAKKRIPFFGAPDEM